MTFRKKTQYKAISRRIHDYLVPSLNTGAKCISPSHLCENVFRLKKNLITPYQTEQYPQFSPSLPNAAVERMGYKTGVSPRSNFKRIRGYRTIRRIFGAVRKGAQFIHIYICARAGRQEECI